MGSCLSRLLPVFSSKPAWEGEKHDRLLSQHYILLEHFGQNLYLPYFFYRVQKTDAQISITTTRAHQRPHEQRVVFLWVKLISFHVLSHS